MREHKSELESEERNLIVDRVRAIERKKADEEARDRIALKERQATEIKRNRGSR